MKFSFVLFILFQICPLRADSGIEMNKKRCVDLKVKAAKLATHRAKAISGEGYYSEGEVFEMELAAAGEMGNLNCTQLLRKKESKTCQNLFEAARRLDKKRAHAISEGNGQLEGHLFESELNIARKINKNKCH